MKLFSRRNTYRGLHGKMSLCPETLTITVKDTEPSPIVKDGVLQLPKLYQTFVKEVGESLNNLTKKTKGCFKAKNGVVIELDFTVCHLPQCTEEDEVKRVNRYGLGRLKS